MYLRVHVPRQRCPPSVARSRQTTARSSGFELPQALEVSREFIIPYTICGFHMSRRARCIPAARSGCCVSRLHGVGRALLNRGLVHVVPKPAMPAAPKSRYIVDPPGPRFARVKCEIPRGRARLRRRKRAVGRVMTCGRRAMRPWHRSQSLIRSRGICGRNYHQSAILDAVVPVRCPVYQVKSSLMGGERSIAVPDIPSMSNQITSSECRSARQTGADTDAPRRLTSADRD